MLSKRLDSWRATQYNNTNIFTDKTEDARKKHFFASLINTEENSRLVNRIYCSSILTYQEDNDN